MLNYCVSTHWSLRSQDPALTSMHCIDMVIIWLQGTVVSELGTRHHKQLFFSLLYFGLFTLVSILQCFLFAHYYEPMYVAEIALIKNKTIHSKLMRRGALITNPVHRCTMSYVIVSI